VIQGKIPPGGTVKILNVEPYVKFEGIDGKYATCAMIRS